MIRQKNFITIGFIIALLIAAIYISGKLNLISVSGIFEKDQNVVFAQFQNQKEKNNDEITNSRRNIITETVKNVSPAIVGINVIEIREFKDPFFSFFDDPFFQRFFGNRGTYNREVKGLGSGYIISSDGYIVTNDHVAGNATKITVTLTDGRSFDAKIIGSDNASDICLLNIDGKDLPFVSLGNSDDIIIG